MRKFFLIITIVLFTCTIANSETQNPIIKDVRGEIFDNSAELIIEANCTIEYLDYTLQNPPRIIIDPIGKVYSDLKDVITFASGPVKKVSIIKGPMESGLAGKFYSLDMISIELATPSAYKIKKEIEKESLIVEIGNKKEVELSKLVPEAETEEAAPGQGAVEPLPTEAPPPETIAAPETAPVPAEKTAAPAPEKETIKPEELTQVPKPETSEVIPLPGTEKKEEMAAPMAPPAGEPIKIIYTIGEGDNLDISVWQHPELDRKVIVRPDGYVSFPLVGDIKAVGLTPPQLASNIKENLTRLIKDPQVTVIVASFGSKNVFVLGEVTKPGSYPYRGGTTVLDAISDAGGWRNSAVLNSVILVRKAFTQEPEAHRLNVYALVKNGDFSQNMPLGPGDIIYVPKSFIANIGGFIENLKVSIGAYVTDTTAVLH